MIDHTCPLCVGSVRQEAELQVGTMAVSRDERAVTPGHRLVFPTWHTDDLSALSDQEVLDLHHAASAAMDLARREDPTVAGFNVGINLGRAAGQTVPHLHLHVIPRRPGDTPDPAGGVRGVLPEQRRPW